MKYKVKVKVLLSVACRWGGANLVPRACDPWEGNEGSGIIRCRKPGILAKIELRIHFNGQSDSSLKRIISEPSFPSQGSQARGTRLGRSCLDLGLLFLLFFIILVPRAHLTRGQRSATRGSGQIHIKLASDWLQRRLLF